MAKNIAFVLINTELGSEREVLTALRKLSEVKEAHVLFGVYDIIARIESDSVERLKEVVNSNIRSLSKVRSTLTMISAEITD